MFVHSLSYALQLGQVIVEGVVPSLGFGQFHQVLENGDSKIAKLSEQRQRLLIRSNFVTVRGEVVLLGGESEIQSYEAVQLIVLLVLGIVASTQVGAYKTVFSYKPSLNRKFSTLFSVK